MRLHRQIFITLLTALLVAGSLSAQQRGVNRQQEREQFPDLQASEKAQELNIRATLNRYTDFGNLVPMARNDREKFFLELEDPHNFQNTFRDLKYTPRNTYIRYVRDNPEVLLVGLGTLEEFTNAMNARVQHANSFGIESPRPIEWGGREGVELTQFDFIWEKIDGVNTAIGSRRKSVTLFYTEAPGEAARADQPNLQIDMIVVRTVEDNFNADMRHIEVIVDPSPRDEQMDDILIFHRENQKPVQVTVLGAMRNTPNSPHRLEFKRSYYAKLNAQFHRFYQLVDAFSDKDGHEYNQFIIEELRDSLNY